MTSFTVTAPSGFSVDYVTGERIYYTGSDGKLHQIRVTSVLTPEQINQANVQAGSAMGAIELGKQVLLEKYGIDVTTLPRVNPADMDTLAAQVNGLGSNGLPKYEGFNPQEFEVLKETAGEDISQTFNADIPANAVNPNANIPGNIPGGIDTVLQAPQGTTIGASLNNQTGIENLPNLQPGDRGDNVKTLQAFLLGMGYNIPDGITGYFGPQTQKALTDFQNANGIDTAGNPGYFGPRTKTFLSSGVTPTSAPDGTSQPSQDIPPEGSDAGPVQPDPNITYEEDISLDEILAASNLSDDQKEMIRQIYGTISTNDEQNAARIAQNIAQAMEFSNPYFKAQARIALDALTRGIAAQDTDLATREQQLANTLNDLREDIAAGKDLLSFEEARDLREVERNYQSQLRDTRQNLAAAGFTSSSRRARQEDILEETTGDIRESTTRAFGERRRNLTESLERGERDTAAEIQRLSELAQRGKLQLFREAEQTLGSNNLPALPGLTPLGGISGDLTRQQAKDALAFSGANFAF